MVVSFRHPQRCPPCGRRAVWWPFGYYIRRTRGKPSGLAHENFFPSHRNGITGLSLFAPIAAQHSALTMTLSVVLVLGMDRFRVRPRTRWGPTWDPAARVSAHGGWKAKPTPDLEPGTASSPVMQNRPAGSCRVLEYVPWGGACRANPSRRIRKLRLGPSSQPFSREPRTRLGTLVRSGY